MAASQEDHNVYDPEDLDEDEDDEEESEDLINTSSNNNISTIASVDNMIISPSENDVVVDDEDDDVDVDEDDDVDDSTSSSNLAAADNHHHHTDPSSLLNHHHHLPSLPSVAAGGVTVALPADESLPYDPKRQRIDEVTIASATAVATAVVEEKKPIPSDESRRLFQRLWTDEDEIELLQGFLEYTTSRGVINSSHHHDTTAFYDQIKSKLQLDCNKNQLVEKLRRLKKKYRNVMNKMGSGKEYVFKTPHDQATFEISGKIWGGSGVGTAVRGGVAVEGGGFDDDDGNTNFSVNFIDRSPIPNFIPNPNGIDHLEKKTPRSRKRSRGGGVKIEEKPFGFSAVPNLQNSVEQQNVGVVTPTTTPIGVVPAAPVSAGSGQGQVTNLIEETVRSCLSPIFKELLNTVMNLNGTMMGGPRGFGFGFASIPMPLGLNGDSLADEKWRKQQILELEVYSKRLELVQDQIKVQLEELRSMGS
ncbi:hypothetical protein ACH5RR_023144 [Cinchona calisaya]|uniref:Glabrous enhancer-binding protein-like DBD domain-containing protein n=1 Tax=Cinchona calisaya TaxID=153742 RepID=A0ABD2ZDQ2_9GENT